MREMVSQNDKAWARNQAFGLFLTYGRWSIVAAELAPFLHRSPTAWWYVSRGEKITEDKVNALRAYCGMPPIGQIHGTSPFTPEHRRRKAAIGATWQEIIEAGLTALEGNQTQGVQVAK